MKSRYLLGVILAFLLAITLVSASTYTLDFTQVGSNVAVKETINGNPQTAYVDQSLIDKSGDNLYFVKKITFNQSFSEAIIRIHLDKGIIISEGLAFPEGYSVETDGQTISIIWNLKNVVAGPSFAMFVTLEDTTGSLSWIYWVLGIAVIIVLSFFTYKLSKRKIKKVNPKRKLTKKQEKSSGVYNYLLDTEKRVIQELKKADRHELWQKQIQNSTGYSKAKVSRLVRNLEARNLVVKIPFGNTNKIRLK